MSESLPMLEHGGRVLAASRRWGRPVDQWLDLSSGISPWSWIEECGFTPSAGSWRGLPQDEDDPLEQAAYAHYGAPALAVAGTQAAIQALPRLRPQRSRVGIATPAYAEHAAQWERAGHTVIALDPSRIDAQVWDLDVLVVCNPNNPDGRRLLQARLLNWHATLARRRGWLVVDEAFVDAEPSLSLAAQAQHRGLVVLRSLGKFFGLGGARVGFVLCDEALRRALRPLLGPWCVAGPSREVALRALQDHAWQSQQRARLREASSRLSTLLAAHGLPPVGGCALFQYVTDPSASLRAAQLASRGILVRVFAPDGLRLGLPRAEADWKRLEEALAAARRPVVGP
jgi:cobalamin biosynthesis protein CobC